MCGNRAPGHETVHPREIDDATRRAALVEFCVKIVSVFYDPYLFLLVPYPYTPSEPLHRTMQPFGSDPHSGSFLDHLAHVRRCIDVAIASYDATSSQTPRTLSNFAKRRDIGV